MDDRQKSKLILSLPCKLTAAGQASPEALRMQEELLNLIQRIDNSDGWWKRASSEDRAKYGDAVYELVDQASEKWNLMLKKGWVEA